MKSPSPPGFTRRDVIMKLGAATAWVGFCPLLGRAAPVAAGDGGTAPSGGPATATVRNAAIEFSLSLARGKVTSRVLRNLDSGETFDLPTNEVLLEFMGGGVLQFSGDGAEVVSNGADRIELLFRGEDVEARVVYHLRGRRGYLRKQISLRCSGRPRRLMRADLENWMGIRRDWRSSNPGHVERLNRLGSHPIYSDTVFAGVEFIAAFNEFGGEGFILRSRPGALPVAADWVELSPTVVGVARTGTVREAFLAYLDDIRVRPAKLVACYNSWWTLPSVVKQEENLALIRALREGLYDRHGVFFDIVTTDMGWSNPRSVWEIDRQQLPNGFDDIRGIVEGAGGRLGLWMSPAECYPPVCDYDWMKANGYFALRNNGGGGKRDGVSLADPKYRRDAKRQLDRLIRGNNLGHVKYDGAILAEAQGHDDLLPCEDSVEPLARYSLELLDASRDAMPDLITEETFLNSGSYVSPWMLKYSDTVYGDAGDDCPKGMNPAPDYRESHTNAREYYIQASQNELWVPQNGIQFFDIVHCDKATGFPNHAAMAVGRGRFFLSTYLNPKFMSDEDWRIYAGLLAWARANQEILRNTVVIPGRVEAGEGYAYAHWLGNRGIVVVRNPSNATSAYELDLRRARPPEGLSRAVCYAQYPYRRGIARGIGADSVISLSLAPWELLFLEIVPERDLTEPVAMGARWYHDPAGTLLVPDRGAEEVTWLDPSGGARIVSVKRRPAEHCHGRVVRQSSRRVQKEGALIGASGPLPTVAFELECEATVPGSASGGRLLLLVEFPGRQYRPSRCGATLNRQPAALLSSSSEESIGDYRNLKPLPSESEWCWYECALPTGVSRVEFSGVAGSESPRIGIWVWSEEQLGGLEQPLSSRCPAPAMPEYRAHVERDGRCLRPAAAII